MHGGFAFSGARLLLAASHLFTPLLFARARSSYLGLIVPQCGPAWFLKGFFEDFHKLDGFMDFCCLWQRLPLHFFMQPIPKAFFQILIFFKTFFVSFNVFTAFYCLIVLYCS